MKVILDDGRKIEIYKTVVFWIEEGRQAFTLNFGIAIGVSNNALIVTDGAVHRHIHPQDAILEDDVALQSFRRKVSKALAGPIACEKETTKRGGTIDKKA